MRRLIDGAMENRSVKDVFLFRVACAECGREYGNKPVRFSKADQPVSEHEKAICDALYKAEMQAARETAVHSAVGQLNYCTVCGRLVCDQCFMICEDSDMCRSCAAKLREQGRPVVPKLFGILP